MNSKYIVLREGYDWLRVGDAEDEISTREYKNLCIYLKNNILNKSIIYDYNKIKFVNYVGIIKVDNLIIELLPKISLTNDIVKDREMLIFMLSKCNKISVNIKEIISTNIIKESLLDILAKIFSENLLRELQKGIYSEYVSEEEALSIIKGKIMLSKSISKNTFIKNKVHCKYDEFTVDNLFNIILKSAVNIVSPLVKEKSVKKKLNIIKNIMEDVPDLIISHNVIESYKLNRMNNRFLGCFTLAKLILLRFSMDKSLGKETGFSILFEMNYLYEEYVGVLLKEVFKDSNIVVSTQKKSEFLLWNILRERNEVALKPDIVVYVDDKPKIIIDTKWKSSFIDNKEVYNQGDIYQMYAYITTYLESEEAILLYPKVNTNADYSKWKITNMPNKKISICEISLESYEVSKRNLYRLITKE